LRILLFWKLLQKKQRVPTRSMQLRLNYTHAVTVAITKIYKTPGSKHNGVDR